MQDAEIRRWHPDRALFVLVIALVVIGLAVVFSASTAITLDRGLSPFHFLIKQIIAAVIGFFLIYLIQKFDYRKLAEPSIYMPALGISVALLLVVLFMPPVNNTHRWIIFGPLSFQPSELAKITLIITLAAVAYRRRELLRSWAFTFLTLAVFVAPVVFLIAIEPDLGTAAVVAIVSLAVLFAGGIGVRNLAIVLMIVAAGMALFVLTSEYRINRIFAYFNPGADPLGSGFQINQSEIALGSGGLLGVGFMESKQKLFYLPAAHTDFIFSVIGEEWGLIGSVLVLALYLALFARGLRIAFSARDLLGFLLAAGVVTMVVGQALLNISVAIALFPTKGIPLPLISSGGTSLITTMAALGILLNVSQYCRKD